MKAPKVTITRVYLVDCDECGESVDQGLFPRTRAEAEEMRRTHLALHAGEEAGQ